MVIEICACCGAIIPTKRLFQGPVKQALYEFLARHPDCSMEQIMDGVYANARDGGPDSANIISVHLNRMRPILKQHGIVIKTRRGAGATYRLIKLEEASTQ